MDAKIFRFSLLTFVGLGLIASTAGAQSWVTERDGAASNDQGPRTAAIIRSQIIDIGDSPALFDGDDIAYVHPSSFDITREGTVVVGFNGGAEEAEGNHAYTLRKPVGGDWSTPQVLEDDAQIDFGLFYQPRNVPDAPVLAYYLYDGAFPDADGAIRVSHDDGQTWSDRVMMPNSSLFRQTTMRPGYNHPLEFNDGTLWLAGSDTTDGAHEARARGVIVPPDNYDNQNADGTAWEAFDLQGDSEDGQYLGDWLVLGTDENGDPHDIMHMSRTNFNEGTMFRRTTDGGANWDDWTSVTVSTSGDGTSSNIKAGISSTSLDWDDPDSPLHGWHVLVGSTHQRTAINVAISQNPEDGEWESVLTLNEIERRYVSQPDLPPTPDEVSDDNENADPTIFQGPDGTLHLMFTGREGDLLKYYELDPYELTGEPIPEPGSSALLGLGPLVLLRRRPRASAKRQPHTTLDPTGHGRAWV